MLVCFYSTYATSALLAGLKALCEGESQLSFSSVEKPVNDSCVFAAVDAQLSVSLLFHPSSELCMLISIT